MTITRRMLTGGALVAPFAATGAGAQARALPGVSDTEIRIGQTQPYSGPLSMLGSTLGRTAQAYFEMVNASGGINGRKVTLISLDDAYSPPRTFEQTRRLVESDDVLLIFNTVGTNTNQTIHRYLNSRKVPHLLILTGANRWNDPKNFPWTVSGMFSYEAEARTYTRHMLASVQNPRIAILSQNDDSGRDFVRGVKQALGDRARQVIAGEATYEPTDPTIDSQMVALKASGANVLMNFAFGKFAVQSIQRARDIGWRPQMYIASGSSSIAAILRPAGLENSVGAMTIANVKNPLDPQWDNDQGMKDYFAFMARHAPLLDAKDALNVTAYSLSIVLAEVLRRSGNDLSRDNVMAQMRGLRGYVTPVLLPGIAITVAPDTHELYESMRLQRFDGQSWVPLPDVVVSR
jgi:branched-chain amino acid transport system substrate-binding protein